jgi:hypothetical protein
MENINPSKNPITTIGGSIAILLALLMYALPMFMEVKKDFTEHWYIPLGMLCVGVLLVLSPDSIVRGANKAIDKGIDEKK